MVCTACGEAAGEGARFCAACGHSLQAMDDERRVVTVLFADLVGFTALSEHQDPERVKNLVDECFDRLATEVRAFGGKVDKVVGDAMVVLFGAPVAHEDDAERAVRAALRMQEAIGDGLGETDEALQIRIGINTGEVLVGAMRAAGSVTAMGDVVNTASRLQTAAEPGDVLVGPSTHAATAGAIAYQPAGLLAAKGREEPVETWRAVVPTSAPGYRARRVDVPLIGRDHEIGVLRHAVGTSIANSRALLVLLAGDVGMGKSRLADEAASWAEAIHGARGRHGRCLPYGEANVWWPVAESLRDGFGMGEGLDRSAARKKILPKVAAAVGLDIGGPDVGRIVDGLLVLLGFQPPTPTDAALVHAEASRALVDYLGGLTARHPMVLQISDLHWADEALLGLIDDVVTSLHHRPLVVVATARPALLDRWSPRAGRHNTTVMHLDPLDRASSARLLEWLVGEPVAPDVAEVILNRSGGNPFFLEELVPLLDHDADAGPDAVADLPDTLRGLVAARLDDLDPAVRAVVQNASVIGHHGPTAGLREMGDQIGRGRGVDEALERLVAEEIMEVADQGWSFRSDLVREVAYQTITKAERARSHLGIAHYLERFVATRRPRPVWVVDQLAHHYTAAVSLSAELGSGQSASEVPTDLMDRARRWVVEAAERAQWDQALPTAVRLYGDAVAMLGSGEGVRPGDVVRLHLARAECAAEGWDLPTARQDVDAARCAAERAGDPGLLAQALVVRGQVEQKEGDIDAAVATLSDAAERFAALDDHAGRGQALRRRGMVEIFGGRMADAQESATAALGAFGESGDQAGQAWANQNLAWIAFVAGRTDEADQYAAQAAASFDEQHDTQGLAWTNGLVSWLRFQQGRVQEAAALADEVLAAARTRDDPWAVAMMTLLQASIQLWSGHVDDAVELATDGHDRFVALGDDYGTGQGQAVLGRALVMAGRAAEGFAMLELRALAPEPQGQTGNAERNLPRMSFIAAALQAGEPQRVASMVGSLRPAVGLGTDDPAAAHGLFALQSGDVAGAEPFLGGEAERGGAPSLLAARALYAAAAGTGDAGLLAEFVEQAPQATYLDRTMAQVAAALECGAARRTEDAQRHVALARSALAPTGDRMAPIVVDLAQAGLLDQSGGDGASLEADALARAGEFAVRPVGWQRIMTEALDAVRA